MSSSPPPVPKSPEMNAPRLGPQRIHTNTTVVGVHFSGPLPPPDLLRGYEDICPGYAARILTTFEDEVKHRREIERRIVDGEIDRSNRQFAEARCGQMCALTITLSAIIAGVYTAICGYEIVGSVIGISGIGGIVTTFIMGRHNRPQKDNNT